MRAIAVGINQSIELNPINQLVSSQQYVFSRKEHSGVVDGVMVITKLKFIALKGLSGIV